MVAAGWAGIDPSAELGGDRLFAIKEAPHDWLFPRMHAAVHHCGAGTTAAAVRAGIPTVPVTFWADQFIWADALHNAGAAPKAVKRRKLTAEWLVKAIESTDSPAMRDAAAALGATVRAETGVGRRPWNALTPMGSPEMSIQLDSWPFPRFSS